MKAFLIALTFLLSTYNFAQHPDKKAVKIAHKVMESMGGTQNWNQVQYIKWNFGKRILHWNKWTGDVRVKSPKDDLVLLVNINTNKGKAYKNGELVTDPKENKQLLKKAKNWWINDSYWLTMPWKLLDPGVQLKYIDLQNKEHLIEMTFENVGNTPNNKYYVFVNAKSNLVTKWAFFKNYNDEKPRFIKPWDNYQKLNDVLLSFNRSGFGPKNVIIKKEFDTNIFTQL